MEVLTNEGSRPSETFNGGSFSRSSKPESSLADVDLCQMLKGILMISDWLDSRSSLPLGFHGADSQSPRGLKLAKQVANSQHICSLILPTRQFRRVRVDSWRKV